MSVGSVRESVVNSVLNYPLTESDSNQFVTDAFLKKFIMFVHKLKVVGRIISDETNAISWQFLTV